MGNWGNSKYRISKIPSVFFVQYTQSKINHEKFHLYHVISKKIVYIFGPTFLGSLYISLNFPRNSYPKTYPEVFPAQAVLQQHFPQTLKLDFICSLSSFVTAGWLDNKCIVFGFKFLFFWFFCFLCWTINILILFFFGAFVFVLDNKKYCF